MSEKIVKKAFSGMSVGAIVMLFSLFVMQNKGIETLQTDKIIEQLMGTMLLGAYMSGITLLFQVEKMSLIVQTVIHFIFLAIGFSITGIVLDWFEMTQALGIIVTFFIIYLVIWIIMYAYNMRLVKKLNEMS